MNFQAHFFEKTKFQTEMFSFTLFTEMFSFTLFYTCVEFRLYCITGYMTLRVLLDKYILKTEVN